MSAKIKMSDESVMIRFHNVLCQYNGVTNIYCPLTVFESLKRLSNEESHNIYENSHKCIFTLNKNSHLTEFNIVPNTYSYKIIRNIQNARTKQDNIQSINRLSEEMPIFIMCVQSMFYLKIVNTNKDVGILIRGIRRLATTLNIQHSVKKEYIFQCFSDIIRILENINI